jgi:hypothetical protein
MTNETTEIGTRYRSKVNNIVTGCTYEVIKKFKTCCTVQLWEDGVKKDNIYKGVKYSILKQI